MELDDILDNLIEAYKNYAQYDVLGEREEKIKELACSEIKKWIKEKMPKDLPANLHPNKETSVDIYHYGWNAYYEQALKNLGIKEKE